MLRSRVPAPCTITLVALAARVAVAPALMESPVPSAPVASRVTLRIVGVKLRLATASRAANPGAEVQQTLSISLPNMMQAPAPLACERT